MKKKKDNERLKIRTYRSSDKEEQIIKKKYHQICPTEKQRKQYSLSRFKVAKMME